MNPKPILKWVGGKTQIIDRVMSSIPSEMNNYIEPFVGGGSVLLSVLANRRPGISGKIYASDINPALIGFYQNIQKKPDTLIAEVTLLARLYRGCQDAEIPNRKPTTLEEAQSSQESFYYWIRKTFNECPKKDSVEASAMFLFLNKTCFRGLYREGPNGFNVPFGNYKHPTILDEDHIHTISALIQPVEFTCEPFHDSIRRANHGDFVYMDPPYAPEDAKSFVSYNVSGFNLETHETLFRFCKSLHIDGIRWAMSNADVELVKKAFPTQEYRVDVFSCRRAINSTAPDSKTNEVLITPL